MAFYDRRHQLDMLVVRSEVVCVGMWVRSKARFIQMRERVKIRYID